MEDLEELQEGRQAGDSGPSGRKLGQTRKKDLEKGKGREKRSPGIMLAWDVEAEYIGTSSSQEEDEEHATCVPMKWKMGGVSAAYESLLR